MLLCFVPRPWQQCRSSRRTWGYAQVYARLHRLPTHQPTAHSPQGADTARRQLVLHTWAHKSHMQQGEVLLLQVSGLICVGSAHFRLVSYRIATCRVKSCLVVSQLGVPLLLLSVLGQVRAGGDFRSWIFDHLPSWALVLDLDFVSRAAGRVDDNYKFSSPHRPPGLARQPISLASKLARRQALAHPHSLPLHWHCQPCPCPCAGLHP